MSPPPGSPAGPDRPPEAPEIERRISLTAKQRMGLPLLAAVPLLALLGLLGEQSRTVHAASASFTVDVTYPLRFRYRQIQPLRVSVRNTWRDTIDTARVSFDTAYISRFSSVRFDPSVTSAYVVPITHLTPLASGLASVELWGERYGMHHGTITVSTSTESITVGIATFVFP